MQINKIQKTNFKGTVHLLNQSRANDPVLRPLIHHLKYNCGNKDIHHYIDVCDIDDSIQYFGSAYYSKVKGVGGFGIHLGGGQVKTPEYVKELIRRTDSIGLVYRIVKNKEKEILNLQSQIKEAVSLVHLAIGKDVKVKSVPKSFLESLSEFLNKKRRHK